MEFEDVTYVGPPVDDPQLLDELPEELARVLRQTNGLVAFRGGFHLRGACHAPAWHSLRAAWRGPESVATRYPATVRADDVPFAQDVLGDQFLLRAGEVTQLRGETGELEPLGRALAAFLEATCADPVGYLSLQPLLAYEAEGGRLEPGQLLNVYPPYCFKADQSGRSYRAVPVVEQLAYLAYLAAELADLPDGTRVQFKITP